VDSWYWKDICLWPRGVRMLRQLNYIFTGWPLIIFEGFLCEGIDAWKNRGMPLEQSGLYTIDDLRRNERKKIYLCWHVREKEEYAEAIFGRGKYICGRAWEKAGWNSLRPSCGLCLLHGKQVGWGQHSGARSLKKVYNLIGGMTAWKEKGYPAKQMLKITSDNNVGSWAANCIFCSIIRANHLQILFIKMNILWFSILQNLQRPCMSWLYPVEHIESVNELKEHNIEVVSRMIIKSRK